MPVYTPQTNPVIINFVFTTSYVAPTNGSIVMDFANAYDGSGSGTSGSEYNFFMILTM